jgi:calcineurin-like phosphoesterase family protein
MNFYLSDPHFFHENVILYSKRPFEKSPAGVEEMNATIIRNINERVGRGDTLYFGGDITFAKEERIMPLLDQINCRNLHLIWGNHDADWLRNHPMWKSSSPLKEIKDRTSDGTKYNVVLCHYKMTVFNRSHHGALQLYGHSHGSLPGNSQQLDIGVDCWDFKPVNLDEIVARMKTLPPFQNADHHE